MTPVESQSDEIKAHQYLYYVKCDPAISDRVYDELCKQAGIFPGGGSDREQDYDLKIRILAEQIHASKT